jgi:carboxymethylenebutenolidase
MTELQRYLAEEIAVDHADGIVTRREALRRLGLLGLGVTAASALLAAFARDEAAGSTVASGARRASESASHEAAAVPARPITFRGPGGRTLMGAWAPARGARGGVLVIHENRGLTDHIRSVAGRFAGERVLGARDRPALGGGRHGRVRRRVRSDGRARLGAHLAPRR